MIEVNLLPGGKKRPAKGRRPSLTLPKIGGLPQDKWMVAAVLVGVLAVGAMAYLFMDVSSRAEEAEAALVEARDDSVRYAAQIARTQALMARRDSIVQRVSVIQEIDQGRYIWPHILDEVARAVPDYTWLTSVYQLQVTDQGPRIQIEGVAGNPYAVAALMENLEASAFLRGVDMVQAQQNRVGVGSLQQLAYTFILTVSYEQPPMEYLDTEPLFGAQNEEMTADTVGL